MKIFIDLTSIYDKLSGIEKFSLNIAKEMIKSDNNNEYLLAFKKEIHNEFDFIENLSNVEYKIFDTKSKLKLNQLTIPKYLKNKDFDVHLFLAFPGPILFANEKVVSVIHDMTPWLYPETMSKKGLIYFRTLIYRAMKTNKLILTVSENSKKDINEKFSHNNINIIYNGVNEKYSIRDKQSIYIVHKKYNIPDKYILCIGTVEPRKNLKLLIDAYADLKKNNKINHKLVITGRYGWKYDSILEKIQCEGLDEDIIFTGFVDEEDLPFVYNGADLFIFPSIYEGFGIPPLEAMACGVPVIVSDSSALPEVVGENGITFRNNDLDDIKSKVTDYLESNDEFKESYKEYCIKRAKLFDWKNESKRLINILEKNFKR